MNLPNKLTVLRIVMVPFFVFFMLGSFVPHRYLWALPAVLREYGSCIAPKLAVLADALSLGGDTVSEKAEQMIAAIEAMRDSFDIPSTLPHLSPNDYTEIARRALKEANPTYPVPQIWDSEKIFSVLRRVQS